MTARQVWESILAELSKTSSPSLLLDEFNYYFNKTITQYVNRNYSRYDVNLLTTDDLRVLKATAILPTEEVTAYGAELPTILKSVRLVILPDDYLHILNCNCIYRIKKTHGCLSKDDYISFPAMRLTADSWPIIINDYYNRPSPLRPYYYLHNVNCDKTIPTNPVRNIINDLNDIIGWEGTDMVSEKYNVITNGVNNINPLGGPNKLIIDKNGKKPGEHGYLETWENDIPAVSNFPRVITLNDKTVISTVERETALRYGNASKVRCEIRYGYESPIYQLEKVLIDYLKVPQTIKLTRELLDLTEDTSLIMEFPDYVCQEIINELTTLIMQHDADPRLQTLTIVTQSIASPAQQLTS